LFSTGIPSSSFILCFLIFLWIFLCNNTERVWCSCRVQVKTMVTIRQPITVENPTWCSLWCGRPGVACYCYQREACGVGPIEDAALVRTKKIG
jgi:hypothetical protein